MRFTAGAECALHIIRLIGRLLSAPNPRNELCQLREVIEAEVGPPLG